MTLICFLGARNEAEIQKLRVAQEEDLKKKAAQLAQQYVCLSRKKREREREPMLGKAAVSRCLRPCRSKRRLQSPPSGVEVAEYERTLQLEEHAALTQYGLEQLEAVQILSKELEKKVLQLKVCACFALCRCYLTV